MFQESNIDLANEVDVAVRMRHVANEVDVQKKRGGHLRGCPSVHPRRQIIANMDLRLTNA
jgi:hypothetical protein